MKGRVYKINRQRAMFAIEIDNNDFLILEGSGSEVIEVDDTVSFDHATQKLTNLTRNLSFGVTLQNEGIPKSLVNAQLKLN